MVVFSVSCGGMPDDAAFRQATSGIDQVQPQPSASAEAAQKIETTVRRPDSTADSDALSTSGLPESRTAGPNDGSPPSSSTPANEIPPAPTSTPVQALIPAPNIPIVPPQPLPPPTPAVPEAAPPVPQPAPETVPPPTPTPTPEPTAPLPPDEAPNQGGFAYCSCGAVLSPEELTEHMKQHALAAES